MNNNVTRMKSLFKKYIFYLIRWQLSTPILAGVVWFLSDFNPILSAVIANFIGGLIFFWVDRFIFHTVSLNPLWEIKENVKCVDCDAVGRGYRIVEWLKYNRKEDKYPQFRCETCKDKKFKDVETKIK